ncbi:hypothetical protein NLJ89_g4756 [Agrocybe chaxingu]|uniref:Uncharacterized protein n=1 Tax=Agrocybe chaxingu TaxID=84603 RepID=A0A9W8K3G6_9AGAR|nr:hypothetical protein NLJ89_g4756 [Agrocybe chaxingu]
MASMSSKEKASHTQSPSLSKQLSTLPTRNAKQFVSSYVESQHSFLKLHISQGRAEVGSWAKSDLQSDLHAGLRQEPLEVLGFGTPVLEPRKRAPSCDSRGVDGKYGQKQRESAKPITNKEKNNGLPANSITPEHEKVKVNKQAPRSDASPARKTAKSKTTGKEQKRTLQEEAGSDGERRERQEERKKRRRIKKDIMAPAYNEDANIKEGIKKDRKRSVKAKAVKPHAAFALMHGFTTTSVGKNRLTLEPRSVGVFKKGKASESLAPVDDKSRNQNPSSTTVEETQRPVIEEDQAPTGVSKPLLDCNPVALNIGIQDGPVLDSGYIITLAGERLLPGDVYSLSDEVLPALLDYTLSESNYSLSSCFWLPDHRDPGIVSSKVDDFTGMDPGFTASVDFDIHWTGEPGGDSEGSVDWSDVCDNMSIMDPAFLVHGAAISEQVLEQLPVQDSLTDDDEAGLSFGEFPCSQDVLPPTFDQDERNSVFSEIQSLNLVSALTQIRETKWTISFKGALSFMDLILGVRDLVCLGYMEQRQK